MKAFSKQGKAILRTGILSWLVCFILLMLSTGIGAAEAAALSMLALLGAMLASLIGAVILMDNEEKRLRASYLRNATQQIQCD